MTLLEPKPGIMCWLGYIVARIRMWAYHKIRNFDWRTPVDPHQFDIIDWYRLPRSNADIIVTRKPLGGLDYKLRYDDGFRPGDPVLIAIGDSLLEDGEVAIFSKTFVLGSYRFRVLGRNMIDRVTICQLIGGKK